MELFDFTFLHSQMFWLVLCFAVLFVFMYKFALPSITKGLDARAEQIREDLKSAQDLKDQAQNILDEYKLQIEKANTEASDIVRQAKDNAKQLAETKTKELELSLQDKSKQAEQRIESAKNDAIEALKETASTLVVKATEKLVLETVDPKKAAELTKQAVKEL